MFQINDVIIYGAQGVCRIAAMEEKNISGVKKEFFLRERAKAYASTTTPNCRQACSGCGANQLGGERTCCPKCKN